MNDLINLISTVGFPIVMCILIWKNSNTDIKSLIENNRQLVESNKELSETNKELVQSNRDLCAKIDLLVSFEMNKKEAGE